jgi:hypothetical protein
MQVNGSSFTGCRKGPMCPQGWMPAFSLRHGYGMSSSRYQVIRRYEALLRIFAVIDRGEILAIAVVCFKLVRLG